MGITTLLTRTTDPTTLDEAPEVVAARAAFQEAQSIQAAAHRQVVALNAILHPAVTVNQNMRTALEFFEARRAEPKAREALTEASITLTIAEADLQEVVDRERLRMSAAREPEHKAAVAEVYAAVKVAREKQAALETYDAETARLTGRTPAFVGFPPLTADTPTCTSMFTNWERELRDSGVLD